MISFADSVLHKFDSLPMENTSQGFTLYRQFQTTIFKTLRNL